MTRSNDNSQSYQDYVRSAEGSGQMAEQNHSEYERDVRSDAQGGQDWAENFRHKLEDKKCLIAGYRSVLSQKSGSGKQLELTLVAFRHSWVLDVLIDLSAYAGSHKLMASADALLDAIEVTMSSLWADPEDTRD